MVIKRENFGTYSGIEDDEVLTSESPAETARLAASAAASDQLLLPPSPQTGG